MPPGLRWFGERLLLTAFVLWGAATLGFISMNLLPGDAARSIAGGVNASVSPAVLAAIRDDYGLDDPVVNQYLSFLGRLATGNLGYSYQLHQPVVRVVADQLGATMMLAVTSATAGLIGAFAIAVATAGRPRLRSVSRFAELVTVSTPGFWIGILLLTVFSFQLGWFPSFGNDGATSLVLPTLTLALPIAAVLAVVAREGIERATEQPFAISARARGASRRRLLVRHALRHSLLPVVTMSGWSLTQLIAGVIVIEQVFARQGLGQVVVRAVNARDLPVVIGVILPSALAVVTINLVLDTLYRVIDPRLTASAR